MKKKYKWDWLDIFRYIRNWFNGIVEGEEIKREIAYADKLAKRFKCKYIYTIYYEEGFDSFINLELNTETHKWKEDYANIIEEDRNYCIVLC